MQENRSVAKAPPWTLLGELATLPQTLLVGREQLAPPQEPHPHKQLVL